MGHNSTDYIRTVIEVMKRATSDKDNFVGDPAFVNVPLARLCSKEHAAAMAAATKAVLAAFVELSPGDCVVMIGVLKLKPCRTPLPSRQNRMLSA